MLPACARLSLTLPAALPEVRGDASLLRQALLELVSNAVESLGGRPGQVAVTLTEQHLGRHDLARLQRGSDRPAGHYAVLQVLDDGCGMDEATRARIFEPFFTTRFTGRGLGLAAVLGIVQAHRGAVDVTSVPGHGSTVRLFLPLAASLGRPPGVVVVLHDEPAIRLVLAHMLESAGFQAIQSAWHSGGDPTAEAHASEGLALLERLGERVRLVLLGQDWSRSDSETALAQLRQAQPGVPIVVVGTEQERERLAALAAPGDAFLPRPFGMSELLDCVRVVLR
jgi:CheY-like chemotaxis protein